MLNWLKERRRGKILQEPFPCHWRDILQENLVHYKYLSEDEKKTVEDLSQVFIAEKNFEGCGGLELNDTIRVIIAAQASLLVLGLPLFQYSNIDSVLVYPTTVTIPPARQSVFSMGGSIIPDQQQVLGLAWQQGAVVLVWDAVLSGARHPERGHNVVYHEFAHILDMRDGRADGTPELHSRELYMQWVKTFTEEFLRLRQETERGQSTLLDSYGSLNEAEFFAVATELFFDRPLKMQDEYQRLYQVLSSYYQQDTADRERHYRQLEGDK
ncbi:M90 family metallopeptidase [Desulfotalea psychrophila]|nr:M90 family metallopeptidase [Desulfotalea psychrophila]